MKYCVYFVMGLIGMLLVMVFLMCIVTPEKTAYGEYTNPVKYWTSDVYVRDNFNMKGNNNE